MTESQVLSVIIGLLVVMLGTFCARWARPLKVGTMGKKLLIVLIPVAMGVFASLYYYR